MASEVLTTYTEQDPDGKITVTSNQVSYAGLLANSDGLVYDDKGINFFDSDFTHTLKAQVTAHAGGTTNVAPWMLANTIEDLRAITLTTSDGLLLIWNTAGTPNYFLREAVGSGFWDDISIGLSEGTIYYPKLVRDESIGSFGQLQCFIYSDELHTTLVDTLTLTLHAKKDLRYVYALSSDNEGLTKTVTGIVADLDLGLGVVVSGFPFFFGAGHY